MQHRHAAHLHSPSLLQCRCAASTAAAFPAADQLRPSTLLVNAVELLPPQRRNRPSRAYVAVLADKAKTHAAQDTIRKARTQQIRATDLLAKLLQAPQPQAVAAEHVESLDQDFFTLSGTYLDMRTAFLPAKQARKEGNADVSGKLEQVLKVAMEEKQKTLRPEIQLLNALLACKTRAERKKIFAAPDTPERLTMNNRYFFRVLLDQMIKDVGRQPANPKQAELSARLKQVKEEADHRVKQASK